MPGRSRSGLTRWDRNTRGAIEKAPQGAFSYEIPDDVDLSQEESVADYCRAFTSMFSSAELKPA